MKCDHKVAILLATYNGVKFISQQLESILNQQYKDFRCFIHDDGSSDGTVEILADYERKYPDVFTICHYPATGGAKSNFFSLMNLIESEFYAFCDQDDVWFPDKLFKQIKEYVSSESKNQKGFLSYSDLTVTDEDLNIINNSFLHTNGSDYEQIQFKDALLRGICPGCVMLFSRRLRDMAIEIYDIEKIYMHDWWVFALATGCGANVLRVKEPTMYYRQHDHNTLGYHKRDLRNALRGIFPSNIRLYIQEKKSWAIRPYEMASELVKSKHLTKSSREFCEQLINIQQKSKVRRIWFFLENYRGTQNLSLRLLFI